MIGKFSQASKDLMRTSAIKRGVTRSNYCPTEETKVKLSQYSGSKHHASKKVRCIETNETFENTRDVERKLGYKNQSIYMCCAGKQKTGYGYHWEYLEKGVLT
jgi:hypothetical protein